MDLPITYLPGMFADITLEEIDAGILWEQREAPRSEAYYALKNVPYTYGSGRGVRTYYPHTGFATFSDVLKTAWMPDKPGGEWLELLFCNRYIDQHQHLGWHADDSPSVDPNRPIIVISFGAERKIMFRDKPPSGMQPNSGINPKKNSTSDNTGSLVLEHGSVLIMKPGMQQTHLHRIPKHDRLCGPRVSLTFRGLTPGLDTFTDH